MNDTADYAERKIKALKAYTSQADSVSLLRLPDELQTRMFSAAPFIRHYNPLTAAPAQEDGGLFAGDGGHPARSPRAHVTSSGAAPMLLAHGRVSLQ
ncbi:hypothetical protein [Spongiactinospora sp. 9N601]|uniref:hypothetical protein n=1 Tax=Spongiactinospora sp. 9N601 TaxID=3375149 RepID=UPI0037AB4616